MLAEVREHLAGQTSLTDVYFVLLDADTKRVFDEALTRLREVGG